MPVDVTLAFEDFNSKLVEVVAVADVDDKKQFVEVSKLKFRRDFEACWQHHNVFVLATVFFLQIWELWFGHKAKFLLSGFEHKVWPRFGS